MKKLAVLLLCFSSLANAQCVLPQQDGTQIFTADTAETCSGYWLIPATEYSAYLSSVEIKATEIGEAFSWGFGTVLLFAGLAYSVSVARQVINKI